MDEDDDYGWRKVPHDELMRAQRDHNRLMAAVLTEIHLGIAMARSEGVVCGSPQNVRILPPQPPEQ